MCNDYEKNGVPQSVEEPFCGVMLKLLRSRQPGTGPRNGNSRKVLAGVLAQVLAKMGVLAGVLAQVLASCFVSVFPKGPTCQHLCQHFGQHPHFCQHLCQHPRQHFSGIPISGSCTRSPGSQQFQHNPTKWFFNRLGNTILFIIIAHLKLFISELFRG